nr:ATP-binding protein [uncultured Desulfobacter sp.]
MEIAKERALYSNKILDGYVLMIQEKYPEIDIEDLMAEAEIDNYNKTGNHAISLCQSQLDRFHKRLCIITDNVNVAQMAGRYVVKSPCMGAIRRLVLPFVGVRRACGMMAAYAGNLTRASDYTVRYPGKNKIEVTVTPHEETQGMVSQCQLRQGYFQGLGDVFLHNDLTVRHPECMFDGGKVCRYELTWRSSAFPILALLSLLAGLAAAACSVLWLMHWGVVQNSLWLMCPVLLFLGLGWAAHFVKSKALSRALIGIRTAGEEMRNQIEVNAKSAKAVVEIGQVLGIEDTDACIFNRAANIVGKKLRYDRVMIMIANDEKIFLSYRGGYGFTPVEMLHIGEYQIYLEGASEGVFYDAFRNSRTMLVNDIEWLKNTFPQSREMVDRIKPRSFVVTPIEMEGVPIGIMIAGNTVTLRKLDSNDTHRVMGVAQHIGCVYRRQQCEAQQVEFKRQIVQLQKMEALGVLAGGIAHDFNNILSPILGYTDLCLSICPEDGKMVKYLRRVKNASGRAQDLVAQILAFSRQGEKEYIRCHPGPIIKESLKLLSASVPGNIKIEILISENLSPIMADPTQIHQLVMNLCTNAHHAMIDKGGVLTVCLDEIQVQDSPLEETPRMQPGPYLHLQVADTGHGMSRAVMDNIFEPYFTTKVKGRGTGMGLPIIKGIVARLKGYIFVDSTEGEGSCFDIYLPQTVVGKKSIHQG